MKEHSSTVNRRVIYERVVLVKLLPRGVDISYKVVLERSEFGIDLTLREVIYRNNLARGRCNITLRQRYGGSSARGGFTDMCTLASPCVS